MIDQLFGKGRHAKELALNSQLMRQESARKLADAQGDTEDGRVRREKVIAKAGEKAGFLSTVLAPQGAGASAAVATLTGQ